jgi:hypothetical protein
MCDGTFPLSDVLSFTLFLGFFLSCSSSWDFSCLAHHLGIFPLVIALYIVVTLLCERERKIKVRGMQI